MYLDCMSMSFIDQITSEVKEFVEKNKPQKEMLLDVLIKTLNEIKNNISTHK